LSDFFLSTVSTRDVTFKCSDGSDMLACLTTPAEASAVKKSPGVIVIHEAYGLNPQIRGVAKRYAEQGFAALAPNLFSRNADVMNEKNIESAMRPLWSLPPEKRSDPTMIQELMKTLSGTDRRVMQLFFAGREQMEREMIRDLVSCAEYFKSLDSVNGERLGVTGFCLGGGLAYQISTLYPFSASVPYYGVNPKPIDAVAQITSPVLAFYAGEDERVNQGIPAIVEAMVKYKKDFAMKVYKGAQHAFFNENRPVYNRAVAEDAWELTIQFFNRHLKSP
jgi:carboxymethylenebutenolidase